MKVLLLDAGDSFDGAWTRQRWDLVVDLGRAPKSFYETRSCELACRVFSIYDLAHEIDDFVSLRDSFAPGMGLVVDRYGIDWWDVLSFLLQPGLQEVQLGLELASQLKSCKELYATRRAPLAEAVGIRTGLPLRIISRGAGKEMFRGVARRGRAAANLDFVQFRQVIFDKYDPLYRWRRNFAPKAPKKAGVDPVVLLPTAYSNVTKTAFSFARTLSGHKFLAVIARESAAIRPVPANVEQQRLASFVTSQADGKELRDLQDAWDKLCVALRNDFPSPVQHEILRKGAQWLRWGITVRDAWLRVFESRPIAACLCADDSNPYSRIPLLLAEKRGLPAVACHHGALDCRMIFKNHRFSAYLAKGDMERDYLERVCKVAPDCIKTNDLTADSNVPVVWRSDAPHITFFTEPYETDFWRAHEVYRELLPQLVAVARIQQKKVMVKLHPFESIRKRRGMIDRVLSRADREFVEITDAPLSPRILQNTWCAVTVESTVAFECASVGIPVFLCGWLRHACAGYVPQYAHFGVGRLLNSAAELRQIPEILRAYQPDARVASRLTRPLSKEVLSQVLGQPHPVL